MWSRAAAPHPQPPLPRGFLGCIYSMESFCASRKALQLIRPQRVAGASGLGGAGERPRRTALLELRWRAGFVGTPTQIQVITPPPPPSPRSPSAFSLTSLPRHCSGQLARSQHGLRRRVLVTKMPEQPPHPGHCFAVRCERAPAISSFLSFLLFCFS